MSLEEAATLVLSPETRIHVYQDDTRFRQRLEFRFTAEQSSKDAERLLDGFYANELVAFDYEGYHWLLRLCSMEATQKNKVRDPTPDTITVVGHPEDVK